MIQHYHWLPAGLLKELHKITEEQILITAIIKTKKKVKKKNQSKNEMV